MAWVRRFTHNSHAVSNARRRCDVTIEEVDQAETDILRIVQQEEFIEKDGKIRGLSVQKAKDGLYHVKTKLTHQDLEGFRFPVLMPSKHQLTELLIQSYHREFRHAGTQFLMCKIREKFWILSTRKTINRITRKCQICLRHSSKSFSGGTCCVAGMSHRNVESIPDDRVDLAGPLYMRNGEKALIVLFTCAVYRCVHLDFVTSLNTEAFLNCLERFINVRGRPAIVYSDNGTNFVGTVNLFNKLDWKTIEKTVGIRRIKWIFNPPSAAWWGGWWERLIRTGKKLMKRMLGNARLNYEHLRTCLSYVENTMNERPLTAVTEDSGDLMPLTPAMFLRGIRNADFPEGETLQSYFQQHYLKRRSLQQELKQRFRSEYLSQLVQRSKEQSCKLPKISDIMLVGSDDLKRLQWPMARIVELISGRDNVTRTARVRTQHGTLLRPIQKLYPLEVSSAEEVNVIVDGLKTLPDSAGKVDCRIRNLCRDVCETAAKPETVVTKSGSKINKPKRLTE